MINWEEVGQILDAIVQFGGAWAVVLGVLIVATKYFKQIWVFLKDMVLAPIRVKSMMLELKHNGGASIKDSLLRIENRQISNEQKLIYVMDSLDSASFESDAKGNCIKISANYSHLVGKNDDDLLGSGWMNSIFVDDRDEVWEAWQESMKNSRRFALTYRMTKDKEIFKVFCRAYPLISSKNEILGWFGILKKLTNEN